MSLGKIVLQATADNLPVAITRNWFVNFTLVPHLILLLWWVLMLHLWRWGSTKHIGLGEWTTWKHLAHWERTHIYSEQILVNLNKELTKSYRNP